MRGYGYAICALLALTGGVAAHAAPPGAPEPDCFGVGFTDARGDQVSPDDAVDLVEGWFGYSGGKMTANLRGANIPAKPPEGVRAISYTFGFQIGETHYMASAFMERDGTVEYRQSLNRPGEPNDPPVFEDRLTTGRTFPGKDGVIQIDLVPHADLRDGAELVGYGAGAWELRDSGAVAVIAGSDEGPDDNSTQTIEVRPCDGTSATPPPPAPPAAPPAPGSRPGPTAPGATPSDPSPPAAQRGLAVAVSPTARLRGRRVTLRLAAPGAVSDLRVRLERRGRRIASARLVRLEGLLTVRLRVPRATRPGRYTLRVTGLEADGVRRALRATVRVSR